MLYHIYDIQKTALSPFHITASLMRDYYSNPSNPLSFTAFGRNMAATAEMSERALRHFNKPEWGITHTKIKGKKTEITIEDSLIKPFCSLKHFKRKTRQKSPKLFIIAPLSGHYATLLRGTVEALLPDHDIYITDWHCAKSVPLSEGSFDLDDYIEYIIDFLHHLGGNTHIMAVCQPAVPVMAAVSLMHDNKKDHDFIPKSMTIMGGPIDTAAAPTSVTKFAESHPLSWYKRNVTTLVPPWHKGGLRSVYPGFLQLTGFLSMNPDKHLDAHIRQFKHLTQGDGSSAETHRNFYDEYMSVMDMSADFYLQTIDRVFHKRLLAKREFLWHGKLADPASITKTALFTIEGELDDISAPGQTFAAHDLCNNIPKDMKTNHIEQKTGHYGIFNGTKYRKNIAPLIKDFISKYN